MSDQKMLQKLQKPTLSEPTGAECAKRTLEVVPQTMREIRSRMRLSAKPDLTVPQFRILNRLRKGPSINRDLADWMGVATPTMSRMVSGLVRRGYVHRGPAAATGNARDGRQVSLSLTPKGERTLLRIRKSVQSDLALRFRSLSAEEKRALCEGLIILKQVFAGSAG